MKQMIRAKSKIAVQREIDPPFPAHAHACLNCGQEISGSYCSSCGQSANTHRLSIMHFVMHDLVHSLWHLDRGIFFTLKEVLIRPGYAALDYIRGKRAGKFPILTLLLLLIGATLWLRSFGHHASSNNIAGTGSASELVKWLNEFVRHNVKWILLSLLPVMSLSTLIVFYRTRLNYTEHLVVNSYVFGGLLVALLLIKLVGLAFPAIIPYTGGWVSQFGLLFYIMGYWQAFHKAYSIPGIIWRFVALFFLGFLLLAIVIIAALLIAALVFHVPGTKNIFFKPAG